MVCGKIVGFQNLGFECWFCQFEEDNSHGPIITFGETFWKMLGDFPYKLIPKSCPNQIEKTC